MSSKANFPSKTENTYNSKKRRMELAPAYVDCNVTSAITPEICAKLITEITKYVISHKLIPCSYEALKRTATTELAPESEQLSRKFVQYKNHHRKIKEAFTTLENIFKNVGDELQGSTIKDAIQEVALVIGATSHSPREIYRILVPPLLNEEDLREQQRLSQNRGLLQWFRCIVMSEELNRLLSKSLNATNMYVLLKRKEGKESNAFVFKDGYTLPKCLHQAVICLAKSKTSVDVQMHSASDNLANLDSVCKTLINDEVPIDEMINNLNISSQDSYWFQSKLTVKGFKVC